MQNLSDTQLLLGLMSESRRNNGSLFIKIPANTTPIVDPSGDVMWESGTGIEILLPWRCSEKRLFSHHGDHVTPDSAVRDFLPNGLHG